MLKVSAVCLSMSLNAVSGSAGIVGRKGGKERIPRHLFQASHVQCDPSQRGGWRSLGPFQCPLGDPESGKRESECIKRLSALLAHSLSCSTPEAISSYLFLYELAVFQSGSGFHHNVIQAVLQFGDVAFDAFAAIDRWHPGCAAQVVDEADFQHRSLA